MDLLLFRAQQLVQLIDRVGGHRFGLHIAEYRDKSAESSAQKDLRRGSILDDGHQLIDCIFRSLEDN